MEESLEQYIAIDGAQAVINTTERLLDKEYLDNLNSYLLMEPTGYEDATIRLLKINNLVYDDINKFDAHIRTILNSAINEETTLGLIFKKEEHNLSVYLAVKHNGQNGNSGGKAKLKAEGLKNLIESTFCGSSVELETENEKVEDILENEIGFSRAKSVSIGYVTPSIKNDDFKDIKSILERKGNFTILLLAENIQNSEISSRLNGWLAIKDQLHPLSKAQMNTVTGKTETETKGKTKTLTESITKGFSQSMGFNKSNSTSTSIAKSITKTIGGSVNVGATIGGVCDVLGSVAIAIPGIGTAASLILKTVSATANASAGVQASKGITETNTETQGESTGFSATSTLSIHKTKGHSDAESESHAESISASNGETREHINGRAINLIERIDGLTKAINESRNIGLWNLGIYVFGEEGETAGVLNSIKGFAGSETSCYDFFHASHTDDDNNTLKNDRVSSILLSLKNMVNPVFASFGGVSENGRPVIDLLNTVTSTVNTIQLSHIFTLPKKALPGFPVKEIPSFGRNAQYRNEHPDEIVLGNVVNCEQEEERNTISLSLRELNRHTMVVGTTRSGKTHATKVIIHDVLKQKIPVLVFDPKRDEDSYIKEFKKDFVVYGDASINRAAYKVKQLKLNIFSYDRERYDLRKANEGNDSLDNRPDIYNHIETLRPIFSLMWASNGDSNISETWPIFRKALFKSYLECESFGGFPTPRSIKACFEQLALAQSFGSNNSEYVRNCISYVRARIEDLMSVPYFDEKGIDGKELFENNVIVNLKDYEDKDQILIAGYLLNYLQHYLINKNDNGNSNELRYLTVFEEAHKIFKKESGSETKNAAVESLAEKVTTMAALGEGFIYVDQSPSLLHTYIQNNTNNKLCFNLVNPDDVEMMAKAMGIDDKKKEHYMTKFAQGTGLIKTNELLDEVLCKIRGKI